MGIHSHWTWWIRSAEVFLVNLWRNQSVSFLELGEQMLFTFSINLLNKRCRLQLPPLDWGVWQLCGLVGSYGWDILMIPISAAPKSTALRTLPSDFCPATKSLISTDILTRTGASKESRKSLTWFERSAMIFKSFWTKV